MPKLITWCEHNKNWLLAIMAVILIASYTIDFFYHSTEVDQSYYVGCARLILEGKYPFVDYNISYPPLVFYIVSIVLRIFPDTVYTHLAVLYAFICADTFIIYKLAKKINPSPYVSFLTIAYFLFLTIKSRGTMFVLEPFVLFFGLMSLLAVQSKNKKMLFVAGVSAMCATWCKQYGIGFILLCLLYTIVDSQPFKKKLFNLSAIIAGMTAGFFAVFGISQLHGAEYSDLSMLSGNDYEREGWESLLIGYLRLSGNAHILTVFLFLIPFYFRSLVKNPMAWVCAAGTLGFMLQCYVRCYPHYFILTLPFISLFIPVMLNSCKTPKTKTILLSLVCLSLFAKSIEQCVKDVKNIQENERKQEITIARQMAEIIPCGSNDVYVSLRALRVVNYNYYKPSLLKQHGMTNGFSTDPVTTGDYLSTCQWLLIDSIDIKDSIIFNEENLNKLHLQYKPAKLLPEANGNSTWIVYKRIKKQH